MRRWRIVVLWGVFLGLSVSVSGGWLLQHGCGGTPPLSGTLRPTRERSQKLMALAAEEAALIPDIDARLTRLLNFADTQSQRGWSADAKATLAGARTTLESGDAKALSDHARVSGWVSISELSRRIEDAPAAAAACEQAVASIRALEDPARRCDYVMGVANELQYSRGPGDAAALLAQAGPWAREIDDVPRRRQALLSFAAALFNLDDYAAGQQMLRADDDVAWRSDTLVRLASLSEVRAGESHATPQAAAPAMETQMDAAAQSQPYFGRPLTYREVFCGQKQSQTVKD